MQMRYPSSPGAQSHYWSHQKVRSKKRFSSWVNTGHSQTSIQSHRYVYCQTCGYNHFQYCKDKPGPMMGKTFVMAMQLWSPVVWLPLALLYSEVVVIAINYPKVIMKIARVIMLWFSSLTWVILDLDGVKICHCLTRLISTHEFHQQLTEVNSLLKKNVKRKTLIHTKWRPSFPYPSED